MSDRFEITTLDISIVIGYLVLSRVIPLVLSSKSEDTAGYFLGGRRITWPLIGLSLFATNIGGANVVGLAGSGYSQGIAVYSYEWMAALILVFFLLFILPTYLRTKLYSMPEFLGRRFDKRTRIAYAGYMLFALAFLEVSAALYAGAIVIQTLFPDIPLWVSVVALALLAGVYTVIGGLGAVMISDAIQGVVVIAGGAALFFLTLQAIPSWEALREAAPERHLQIIQPIGDEQLPWPGLLTGLIIIGIYFWTTNQLIVQRTLGARSTDHGRWGSTFGGFLKLLSLFIFIFPGTIALLLYPNLTNPDLVWPTLAFDLMPVGVRGVLLAALVAAITSTLDSALNASSTVATMDFVTTFRPNTSEQTLVRIGRISTVVVMLLGMVWAPQIVNFETLWNYLQSVLSYLTPPIVATFLMGIFWTRTTRHAAFWTLVTLTPLGVALFIAGEILGLFTFLFLYYAAVSFVASLLLLVTISLLTQAPSREQVEELTWRPALWREETEDLKEKPFYQNYRFWSVVLVVSTLIIVYIFR